MFKILIGVMLGFALTSSGIYLSYLYLKTHEDASLLFLIGSFILSALGIYILIRASKSTNDVIGKRTGNSTDKEIPPDDFGLKKMLERNNAISNEWKQINTQRNKLKMLEISSTPTPEEFND